MRINIYDTINVAQVINYNICYAIIFITVNEHRFGYIKTNDFT